jgi:integrase
MRLSDLAIKTLPKPEKGQRTYFDDTISGFGVRISQAGSRSFILELHNPRKFITIGRYGIITLAQAREKAKTILAERQLGIAGEEPSITYGQALKIFLDAYQRKPSTRHETERLLTRHFSSLASRPLSKIKAGDVAAITDALKPSEGKHALTAAKTFFRWCASREYVADDRISRLRSLRTGEGRERVLDVEELRRVLSEAELSGNFGMVVQLLILTGQRRGQIAHLRGELIDRENRTITWPGELMKGNRTHTIPYGDGTAVLLRTMPETGLFFPSKKGEPFNNWGMSKLNFDRRCPLPHWTLHDLRRTYATIMASLGIAPHVIERLLDHRTGTISGVAAIYNRHHFMPEMRAATERYEAHIVTLTRRGALPT